MVSLQSHHMSASWLFPPSPAWQIYTWADHRLLSPPLTCSFLRRRVWGSVRSGRAHLWLMPLTLNLMTEMSKCLSSGCGKLRPSRVQSVVSSQGSMDSDMQGKCCAKMNDGWAAWLALEMFEEWGGCDKLEILRVISCQIETYRMKATHKMQVYSHTRHQNNTWLCFPVYQHVTRQMIWVGPTYKLKSLNNTFYWVTTLFLELEFITTLFWSLQSHRSYNALYGEICFHSQWTKIQFKTRCKQTRTLQQGKVM